MSRAMVTYIDDPPVTRVSSHGLRAGPFYGTRHLTCADVKCKLRTRRGTLCNMGILECALVCVGLFLLFPKGFRYLVGTWVGACTAGFLWSLFEFSWLLILGWDASMAQVGWSFLAFIVTGIVVGIIIAAKG